MPQQQSDPREPRKPGVDDTYLPDMTPRREGGDDSLAEASPYDYRDDEKVIVNEQRDNKMANQPSQNAANSSEETKSGTEAL